MLKYEYVVPVFDIQNKILWFAYLNEGSVSKFCDFALLSLCETSWGQSSFGFSR
jgi:hypothetical protein